ncbi:aminotransferase class V-fold PLP-dependent enzyme [Paracoccus sp. pheM1]|uniref:aminotransferase class V-fold PLP-dependent enzyme n=1 Tax=Paracoccus sp. pheM1 TaxID=2831675 RepID=UPI001BDB8F64|nr:aminotransferase class V-fold PLP-dependent enzyme [Paracoccus sp. pheM1]MBT0780475.1 aminotransferase class V-fold PLP-dependent enzyme [Paracoccus sp. pheM1]
MKTRNPMPPFDSYLARLGDDPMQVIHDGVIGRDAMIDGPFGPRRMIYADYIASGRALRPIEDWVMENVLPWYANSHTEASHCGGTMTRMRRAAREAIGFCTHAGAEHAVIFTGSGATQGINRLVHLMAAGPGTTVLIGPYEHHSNILPWRESGAEVVTIPEAATGGPDLAALRQVLARAGGPVIGSFSAASNVTGTLTDMAEVTRILKAAGARVVWDQAGGAPYLPIDMRLGMDAVAISPHKFIGGPGASGVLILRRDAVLAGRPTLPGGGTVRFVSPQGHDYAPSLEAREEGGTPNVIGDIRAALVFLTKAAVGQDAIDARNAEWLALGMARLRNHPRIELLGNPDAPRLPFFSFRIRDGRGGFVHQQLATRMLSDLYGVQARGGCACAGPYVHHLLGLGPEDSARLRAAILAGDEIEKPGFVRLNLCWAAPRAEVEAILDAVCDLADHAADHLAHYRCDRATAIFTPVAAA